MAYEGYVDSVTSREIAGWVFDDSCPNDSMSVEIVANGKILATLTANQYRKDLEAAGKGNGKHAFTFRADSNGASSTLAARLAGKRWFLPLSNGASPVPPRIVASLAHSVEYGLPVVEGDFSTAVESPDEPQIVSRLIEAFHRALEHHPQTKDFKRDLWSEVSAACHGEITKLIARRDVRGTAQYLRNAHARNLTWGITQGETTTREFRNRPEARQMALAFFVDALVSLGEALGILSVESPEQHGQWGENFHRDPNELIDAISARVRFDIVLPQVIDSYFGIKTPRGPVSLRDCCSLYAALRLREIARDMNVASPRICEIGGGLGAAAYYAARLGVASYTLIDLPIVNVLQGYFLLRALGKNKVSLYGEPPNPTAAIRILPTFCFANSNYDFLFNQDSFPEMHQDYSTGYLRDALKVVSSALLSINQESRAREIAGSDSRQRVVPDLINSVGGYRQIYRSRYWMKAGYVEELYRIENR